MSELPDNGAWFEGGPLDGRYIFVDGPLLVCVEEEPPPQAQLVPLLNLGSYVATTNSRRAPRRSTWYIRCSLDPKRFRLMTPNDPWPE